MNTHLAFCVVLATAFSAGSAQADERWNRTITAAVAAINREHREIQVQQIGQATVALRFFQVTATGERLAHLTVEGDSPEGLSRALERQVADLLKTPSGDLRTLQQAHDLFERDRVALERDFGIVAYVPTALPPNELYPEGRSQLLGLDLTDRCRSANLVSDTFGMGPVLKVRFFDYYSGRQSYPKDLIYRSGDLRRALFGQHEVLKKLLGDAEANEKNCTNGEKRRFWGNVAARLRYSLATQEASSEAENSGSRPGG